MEIRSIKAVVKALNENSVRYIIVGGLAVNVHGYERLTRGIDLVIGLQPDNILRGLKSLFDIGYSPSIPVTAEQFADPVIRETWRREKMMLVLKLWSDIHRRTPLDIFVYEPFDFEREYRNAERFEFIPGLPVPIVTFDTLLEMKRDAGRPNDLVDIAELEEAKKLREASADDKG